MASQTMFMCVLDIQFIRCSLDRPWFSQSSGPRRSLALSPSPTSRPHEFLGHFTSLFHRPQTTVGESMGLQQPQTQHMSSHPGPRAVEVAPVRDKQALFVSPRQETVSDQTAMVINRVDTFHLSIQFTCATNLVVVVYRYPVNDPFMLSSVGYCIKPSC
ncbi:hypothetical protein AZE42_10204 [Rhizopogon vesiculosus]|uniref:Uncharacterized protein n=1 Tax=Rhizopogon vesiculosus TaxID=180088 RepID=A0A1J8QTK6_9AGAM|nr:hypothetical protein AZE42_10204 [Rhizopogon vesiculosus]